MTLPTAVAWAMLGRPSLAMLTTLERDGTESTVIASRSLGQRERRRLAGALHQLDEHRPRLRLKVEPGEDAVGERHQPEPETEGLPGRRGATRPADSSVASSREAVLALTPIRRASSLTPRA